MRRVTKNFSVYPGNTLAYRVYGPKLGLGIVPIVMIHGRGSNQDQFTQTANMLADRGNAVITFDLRGHGRSTFDGQRYEPCNWTLRVLVRDIHALLCHLGVDKFHLFGHSMGGVIALEYLAQHPRSVATLIISGTHLEIRSIPVGLIWLDRQARSLMTPAMFRWYMSRLGCNPFARTTLRRLYHDSVNRRRDGAILRGIPRYDYRDALTRCRHVPVRIIHPMNDNLVNPWMKPSLDYVMSRPGGLIIPIDDAGHFANLDCPEEFCKCLLQSINF